MTPIIEDRFSLYRNNYITYDVKLDYDFLSYTPNASKGGCNTTVYQSLKDIIGCALMRSNNAESKAKVYITIYSYPMVNGKNKKRRRKTVTFEISSERSYEENLKIATRWRKLLYHALYHYNGIEEGYSPLFNNRKSILVFINPKSGPGTALDIFQKKVKPLFAEAELDHDIIITDHANHAFELIQHKDLRAYSGIVIIAGDGLIYEVYNGLLQRSDSSFAVSIPVGVIPGGSGNGLARSIAHEMNEPYLSNPALVSTLNIVNPAVTPLDLVLLQTHTGHRILSFLSIGFGILSDIDIDSERLRRLGEARFIVYGVTRLINLRKYKARLSFKVAQNMQKCSLNSSITETSQNNLSRPVLQRSQTVVQEGEYDGITEKPTPRPHSMNFEDMGDVVTPTELVSDAFLQQIPRFKEKKPEKLDKIVPNAWEERRTSDLNLKEKDLLNEPIPTDWETVEDDFVSIYAVNVPYIGSDSCLAPKSTLSDGVMWLCYIRGNASKSTVSKWLVSLSSGAPLELPGVTYVPVTDFRLVPLCTGAKITVDGELIQLGPIHATVLPSKGRLMVRRS